MKGKETETVTVIWCPQAGRSPVTQIKSKLSNKPKATYLCTIADLKAGSKEKGIEIAQKLAAAYANGKLKTKKDIDREKEILLQKALGKGSLFSAEPYMMSFGWIDVPGRVLSLGSMPSTRVHA